MIYKLEKFEGPLDLLLKMIEEQKLSISDISLAKVAEDYIDYIRQSNLDPEAIADFLVVASKLLLIKSRALLPFLFLEEEQEIAEFEQQLKMYQQYLAATKKVEALISQKNFMFARQFNRQAILASHQYFSPPKKLTAAMMANVLWEMIAAYKPLLKLEEKTLAVKINIEDKIAHIKNLLNKRIKFVFSELSRKAGSKTEVIVSFLAMLELIKQQDVAVEQMEMFGEIEISRL